MSRTHISILSTAAAVLNWGYAALWGVAGRFQGVHPATLASQGWGKSRWRGGGGPTWPHLAGSALGGQVSGAPWIAAMIPARCTWGHAGEAEELGQSFSVEGAAQVGWFSSSWIKNGPEFFPPLRNIIHKSTLLRKEGFHYILSYSHFFPFQCFPLSTYLSWGTCRIKSNCGFVICSGLNSGKWR